MLHNEAIYPRDSQVSRHAVADGSIAHNSHGAETALREINCTWHVRATEYHSASKKERSSAEPYRHWAKWKPDPESGNPLG